MHGSSDPAADRAPLPHLAVGVSAAAHWRHLLQALPDAVICFDQAGIVRSLNRAGEHLTGSVEEQVRGRPVWEILADPGCLSPEGINGAWSASDGTVLLGGGAVLRRANGGEVPLDVRVGGFSVGGERLLVAVARDDSARRALERRAVQSEERFHQLAAHIEDVLYVVEGDGDDAVLTYLSPACEEVWGLPPSELCGRPQARWELVEAAHRQRVRAAYDALLAGAPFDEEYPICRGDGERRWVRDRAFVFEGPTDRPRPQVFGVIHDVTADRQLAEELRQSQKLQAVGTLASGIAHDFNNLLMSIAGSAELALEAVGVSSPARSHLEDILEAAGHGADITRQLLTFGHKKPSEPRPILIDGVLRRMAGLLESLLGDRIALVVQPMAGHAVVEADAAELEQVLLNLAANARDAMPRGGVLTLRTERRFLSPYYARRYGFPAPSRCIRLSVSDNGCGMDEDTRQRMFEPFFTTKEPGKGTGLGLATVFTIVRKLGGHIDVETTPGKGTTVNVLLPSTGELASTPRSTDPLAGGRGRVLVVEDERLVRRTIIHYLTQLGYEVVEAGSAQEALQRCQSGPSIDILITDVAMPDGEGPVLAEAVRRRHPELAVLFVSAYPHGTLRRDGTLDGTAPFLQKPFDRRALGAKLQELAATRSPR